MKKLLFLILAVPLLASAAPESRVERFNKANEGTYFGNREHVNPTSRELREISKDQGMPLNTRKGFPVLRGPSDPAPGAGKVPEGAPDEVPPAVSYRTLGDAAKAGVDPLSRIKPMASTARVEAAEGARDIYYWIGGIAAFVILGGLGFVFALRTPKIRED